MPSAEPRPTRLELADHERVHGSPGNARSVRIDFVAPIHCDPERKDGILATPDPSTGFLHLDGRMTCTGVFAYSDGDTEWGELRTEDEVFDAASMKSFSALVVTNDHPDDFVNTRNVRDVQVGHSGTNVRRDGDFMRAAVVLTDSHTIIEVQSGKMQLSLGYTAEVVDDDGEIDGKRYSARQTNIRGNHLAIVDVGRAGPDCALIKRGDRAAATVGATMAVTQEKDAKASANGGTATKDKVRKPSEIAAAIVSELKADSANRSDAAVETAQGVMDLLGAAMKSGNEMLIEGALLSASKMLSEPDAPAPQEAPSEGEGPDAADEMMAEQDAEHEPEGLEASKDSANARREITRLRAKADANAAELKLMRSTVLTRQDERVDLRMKAREIVPTLDTHGMRPDAIRRAIVLEVNPGLKDRIDANTKEPGYLRSSYDSAIELFDAREKQNDAAMGLAFDAHVDTADAANDPDKAYEEMIARRDQRSQPNGRAN